MKVLIILLFYLTRKFDNLKKKDFTDHSFQEYSQKALKDVFLKYKSRLLKDKQCLQQKLLCLYLCRPIF